MAAPITHIVSAEKVFNNHFPNHSKSEFFIGTSFPDIRYLRVIKREQTHSKHTLPEIKLSESFEAGRQFHCLVDTLRENYMQANDIYSLIPQSKLIMQSLKLLEDELFYEKISDWGSVTSYFEMVLDEELKYPIHKDDIVKWHKLLQYYFTQKPTIETRKTLFESIYFDEESIKEVEGNLVVMRDNKQVLGIIENFYNNFDKLLNV